MRPSGECPSFFHAVSSEDLLEGFWHVPAQVGLLRKSPKRDRITNGTTENAWDHATTRVQRHQCECGLSCRNASVDYRTYPRLVWQGLLSLDKPGDVGHRAQMLQLVRQVENVDYGLPQKDNAKYRLLG